MKTWKLSMMVVTVMSIMLLARFSVGAISAEEAVKLGTALTGVGAEIAGNKDGSIPPYTGGLTTPPKNFKPGSGVRPDPFAAEKPLFSINAQSMAQYADKLTEGTKALMKKHPTYRIDVYKTHRTVAFPDFVIKNTAKNAVKATTTNGGLSLRDAHGGYPFPIPKDGYEAMWNHLVRYSGRAWEEKYSVYVVDVKGSARLSQENYLRVELPYYDDDRNRYDSDVFYKARWYFTAPARIAGETGFMIDPLNMYEKGRTAYLYLPGQRRVKLAPELAFDSPVAAQCGASTYDDQMMYNGSMERYDMKLIGKKEIYIPYNAYHAAYMTTAPNDMFGPKHINPNLIRWELHRVWVVEGTLKPGKRHVYHKRRFYLDEDSWAALAEDMYDGHGYLYRINIAFQVPSYELPASNADMRVIHDMVTGIYSLDFWYGGSKGFRRFTDPLPAREWTPGAITSGGIR